MMGTFTIIYKNYIQSSAVNVVIIFVAKAKTLILISNTQEVAISMEGPKPG